MSTFDFVPARNVEDVRFGGGTAYFDSGQRPSIATLALRALGVGREHADPVQRRAPGSAADLRRRRSPVPVDRIRGPRRSGPG